ncbi:MAG: hypothetical protein K6G26_13970 [Lachnospiraceae bacterium]|nr:hypothetical protein [Lachnospiraceae bacterium]
MNGKSKGAIIAAGVIVIAAGGVGVAGYMGKIPVISKVFNKEAAKTGKKTETCNDNNKDSKEGLVYDLNKDGVDEVITMQLDKVSHDEYDESVLTVYINKDKDNEVKKEWSSAYDMKEAKFADIDEKDDYIEMFVEEPDVCNAVYTHIYRYDGKDLEEIGCVGSRGVEYDKLKGDGELYYMGIADCMNSWPMEKSVELKDGEICEKNEWAVIKYPDGDKTYEAKMDISAYKDKDTKSEALVIKKGAKLHFDSYFDNAWTDSTDENLIYEGWVAFTADDGTKGCFHVLNQGTVDSNGEEINVSDVFDDMYIVQ